jgi:hypothetical protein
MNTETPLDMTVRLLANGCRARLARLLGVNRSTVTGWGNAERRPDGLCGTIPPRYIPVVLNLAECMGVEIDPASLHPAR